MSRTHLSPISLFDPPFSVHEPLVRRAPVLFSSPHSGCAYPQTFLERSRLDLHTLRTSEDCFVDEIFSGVVGEGMPLITAHFPRAYVDVNREPYELDPRMFEGRLPSYANSRSVRVASGLGTVPRMVADQQDIYARRLPVEEALARIEGLYKPYHRALRQTLSSLQRQFGTVLLIDCHSMPALALDRDISSRCDIVLGDRFGTSCSTAVTDAIEEFLCIRGYRVMRNKPYAGGFITEHYGQPLAGVHAVQIEICRSLYMEERLYRKNPGFSALVEDMTALSKMLSILPLRRVSPNRAAAAE